MRFMIWQLHFLGAYYVLTGGWWNWTRTGDGLLYLASVAIAAPCDQSEIYNNVLVDSPNTDAVVPVASQKFPRNVVPAGAYYIPPCPAQDANHFTELKPTPMVNEDLIYIFNRARLGGR